MSSAGWILVCLLAVIPIYDASEIKGRSSHRYRRSLMNLKSMVKAVTGRDGMDFLGYGNWCGPGGSGKPLDPIDGCCQIHDICYDLTRDGPCRKQGGNAVYSVEYRWEKAEDGLAHCSPEEDECKATICMCDTIVSNCLKKNIESYDPNLQNINVLDLIKEVGYLTSP